MQSLCNKQILLGVTGGIAAYKSAELVRVLQAAGAKVRVVMTRGAQEFITPLTLQALSGQPVHTELLDPAAEAAMGHIELARWADVVLIAPASAQVMAKLAVGEASDLLSTLCLATAAPIVLAPAMNQWMWRAEATQVNLATLLTRGFRVFGPDSGVQACGEVGPGRMLEPLAIARELSTLFETNILAGKKVLITAGPTQEAIDPVRYISNHSSGKMGYALARAAVEAGARVLLVSGPVQLSCPDRVERVSVVSALEMYSAVKAHCVDCDIFIGAAAVADFRPEQASSEKIKKQGEDSMQLRLVKNPDIIAWVAEQKAATYVAGFAAETSRIEEHARLKLSSKQLDMVIANDVSDPAIGFNSNDNAVYAVTNNSSDLFPQMSKTTLASKLIERIAANYFEKIQGARSD